VYVSTRGGHRALAHSLGAASVGSENEKPPGLDRAITFAPSGDVVVSALGTLRNGEVVAMNAIQLDRIPEFIYDRLLWGERQIRSVANMIRSGWPTYEATRRAAMVFGIPPRIINDPHGEERSWFKDLPPLIIPRIIRPIPIPQLR
jgi:propanol-preferring alcohol dehydrogenase